MNINWSPRIGEFTTPHRWSCYNHVNNFTPPPRKSFLIRGFENFGEANLLRLTQTFAKYLHTILVNKLNESATQGSECGFESYNTIDSVSTGQAQTTVI